MSPEQFAQKIKEKYPQYQNVNDTELANLVVKKYPQYKSQLAQPEPVPEKGFLEKAGDVADTLFGGGTIGSAIGTQIAKGNLGQTVQKAVLGRDLSPEEEALVAEGPTKKQIAGDVLRVGANFIPVGKLASGATAGLTALGVGSKVAPVVGASLAGAATGAIADTGISLAEGGDPRLGAGAVIGASIPFVGKALQGAGKLMSKVTGKVGGEALGMTTGTSAETLEQAFMAGKKGGAELDTLTTAMRGKTTPEQLVNNIRDSVSTVNTQRQSLFRETLSQFGDTQINTTPAKQAFIDNLEKAGVKIGDNGLDFTGSKLRLVPAAQTKLQTAFTDLMNMPQASSLVDVDTTRQALKALSLAGDDPSANLANKLLDDAVRGVRGVGESVPEYGKMLDEFGETSDFLDELQRGLSTGDKATIDQTYRRMTTALKTNNEQRLSLLKELDELTDGNILSDIAGQQLSEALPRGIIRQIAGAAAGTAALTGGVSASMLPALTLASPRVVGEFVRSLGIASNKADLIIKAIADAQNVLIKIGAISGSVQDGGEEE